MAMQAAVHRNALAPVHDQAEQIARVAYGVAVALDSYSRRPSPEIQPEMQRILLDDLCQVETGLRSLRIALAGEEQTVCAPTPEEVRP